MERKFKVNVTFDLKSIRKIQLTNLNITVDIPVLTGEKGIREIIENKIIEMWGAGDINPEDGNCIDEEYDDYDSEVEDITFKEEENPPFINPNQNKLDI